MKRALIFGVGGQDGSYLAELLLEKDYEVYGTYRRSSYDNLARLTPAVQAGVKFHRCELTDAGSVKWTIDNICDMHPIGWPSVEIYNMADQDEVGWSHSTPGYSAQVTYGGPATILDVLRGYVTTTRFFQPVSSTMFGPTATPQDESTPLNPGSPYACAKAAAFLLCRHYRRERGVYVSCGIMFNHDSPRRGPSYLLQQIARQAVAVSRGERERIELTGPDAWVSVGWAPDYVDAAWRTLQQDSPEDYCVGVSPLARISNLCILALRRVCIRDDAYKLSDDLQPEVRYQPDDTKAHDELGWEPRMFHTEMVLTTLVNHFKEVR